MIETFGLLHYILKLFGFFSSKFGSSEPLTT
jgi:hypothetical protein